MGQQLAALGNPAHVQQAFFDSFENLCSLYGLEIPRPVNKYPFNITEAYAEVKTALRQRRPELDLVIVRDEVHTACLTTVKTYDTSGWLFYIPVRPLVSLLRDRAARQRGLLLSVFAYLYQVAGIPDFINGYVGSTYEMIQNWYDEDPTGFDEADFAAVMESFRAMGYQGKKVFKSIRHPYHLNVFAQRLKSFTPRDTHDEQLRWVCSRFLWMYRSYPKRSIHDSFYPRLLFPQEDERIYPDQYISFFWTGEGEVYQQLMETINVSLQEMTVMEEPLAFQFFDTPQQSEQHDFGFEQMFFESIHLLCELLNG